MDQENVSIATKLVVPPQNLGTSYAIKKFEGETITFYQNHFPIISACNSRPNVVIIDAKSMKNYEDRLNNDQGSLINEIVSLAKKLHLKYVDIQNHQNSHNYKNQAWLYRELIRIFKILSEITIEDYKEIVLRCIKDLESICSDMRGLRESEIMDDINRMLSLLRMVNPIIRILGYYVKENKTIYMCLENIDESAKEKAVDSDVLTQSVFTHEYAHFLHFEYITQQLKNIKDPKENSMRSAVFETVAEYCQMKHALETGNQPLIKWMKSHQNYGYFPGWGYKGAEIVQDAENQLNVYLIEEIILKSKTSWRDAYSLIENSDLIANLSRRGFWKQ